MTISDATTTFFGKPVADYDPEAAPAGVPGTVSRLSLGYDDEGTMPDLIEQLLSNVDQSALDAPGRVQRFLRKHPELVDRIPQKELASHLNLSAETLSRLRHSGKI